MTTKTIKIPFVTRPAVPQTKSLLISAGHSDSDPGASCVHDGVLWTEADVVTEFRDLVGAHLNSMSVDFKRDGDFGSNLPLNAAIALAKSVDMAVEFHCNAFSDPRATGVETLQGPQRQELGEEICKALAEALGLRSRGAKPETSGQHSRLGFISSGGGVIVELFFISNPKDLENYQANKDEAARRVAEVLANAVTAP